MCKIGSLLFILILLAPILIMVKPANSEITKPSVPEFTLKVIDNSYEVPPTYYTDPYTGKITITQTGYRAQNGTIDRSNNKESTFYFLLRWESHNRIILSYPDKRAL